ncbi:HEAT repeat domain-containing protein [Peptostreptococcus equinus]|uniref:HEAT repeat domain-containing protein n=1 Tax=Peptostreptococcus equinus TaxID=3003601 RepID=A0ABY7JPC4_9FIRM|nr:HEAT repeat domain-containing protein [Peptostreptococcus sp. CBA3647]WAW15223.1 HEAT repeat domain-containing protein [Peptostreptococcus sp. CBA3647]
MVIGWENVDDLEDYYISYLLYKQSLSVIQIARVRNKSIEQINDDLIKAKTRLREKNKSIKENNQEIMDYYLALAKDDRKKFIDGLKEENLDTFKKKVFKAILSTLNIDDLMVLVWTAGELKDSRFLNILYPLVEKKHANLRRITYSAIGKIADKNSVQIIEIGLSDSNPQVRQYCAKALASMGNENSIKVLKNIVNNKSTFEKEYVLRACKESIEKIYSRLNI